MINLPIESDGGTIRVGTPPEHLEHTAVVEAHGALLLWDELSVKPHPSAWIFDTERAADWLWEVYGGRGAAAVFSPVPASRIQVDHHSSAVLTRLRRLASINWADVWWPTSEQANIPPLSNVLLATERALETFAVEHLLDDESAVEHALAAIDLHSLENWYDDPLVGERVRQSHDRIEKLFIDYGVNPTSTSASTSAEPPHAVSPEWALAAGDHRVGGTVVLHGKSPVMWSHVARGSVDAAAVARWTLSRHVGETILSVSVPSGEHPTAALIARMGDGEVSLPHKHDSGEYRGWASVPSGLLLQPASARRVLVYGPDVTTTPDELDPASADRQTAVIEHARSRLGEPDALLAQRAARRSDIP